MSKQEKQRLLELAYLYAWGKYGSLQERVEWQQLYFRARKEDGVGVLHYAGNQSFFWSD